MGNSAITGINLGVPAFQQNFVNASLSSGVLTVTHNLNSQYVSVTVFDNNNLIIIPDDVDVTGGVNSLTIDLLSFGTLTGTWRAIIVDTGANVNNIASDLNISGQVAEDALFFDGTNWVTRGGAEKIATGTFTRDTTIASGTQAITSVGFKPSFVLFPSAMINLTAAASWGGIDNGTASGAINDNAQTPGTYEGGGGSIRLEPGSGNLYSGAITTLDTLGFTINWTKTASPTGTMTVTYVAFR